MKTQTYQVRQSGKSTEYQKKRHDLTRGSFPIQSQQETQFAPTFNMPKGSIIANIQRTLDSENYPYPTAQIQIQTKLTVGQREDFTSQVAQQNLTPKYPLKVSQNNENNQPILGKRANLVVQREENRDQLPLRGKINLTTTGIQRNFEENLNQAKGGGSPLDREFRTKIEPKMGADFSGVKIHTDSTAHELSQSIQAKAFTTGKDIFFKQGEYNPHSQGGQEILAHELTHVVQQNGESVQRSPQPSAKIEQETIQRVLHRGNDPVTSYATAGNKSLLYGVAPSRLATLGRLRAQDNATWPGQRQLRTIDEYNGAVGINAEMANAATGIFTVRAALADPNPVANWTNYFTGAVPTRIAGEPDLQAWIRYLVSHRHTIGLYDLGDQTKVGIFGFRKRTGLRKILSKNRYSKNEDPSQAFANKITPQEINLFLRPTRTFDEARQKYRSMNPNKQNDLKRWIYTAFFRRTSKLGIDFVINELNAQVHFNTAAAIDPTSHDPALSTTQVGGLERANQLDQSQNRAITISEFKHLQKGLRTGAIRPGDVNFYDEFN